MGESESAPRLHQISHPWKKVACCCTYAKIQSGVPSPRIIVLLLSFLKTILFELYQKLFIAAEISVPTRGKAAFKKGALPFATHARYWPN